MGSRSRLGLHRLWRFQARWAPLRDVCRNVSRSPLGGAFQQPLRETHQRPLLDSSYLRNHRPCPWSQGLLHPKPLGFRGSHPSQRKRRQSTHRLRCPHLGPHLFQRPRSCKENSVVARFSISTTPNPYEIHLVDPLSFCVQCVGKRKNERPLHHFR